MTTIMFFIGLISGTFFTVTFSSKKFLEVGCGFYLRALSILSMISASILTVKLWLLIATQSLWITNRVILWINCISMEFILLSCKYLIQLYIFFILLFHFQLILFHLLLLSLMLQERIQMFVKKQSYRQHLREQFNKQKHLIFSPIILVLLAIPRLIISFLSGCMESVRDPWLFYFVSTIITNSNYFHLTFRNLQKRIKRCLEIIAKDYSTSFTSS